MLTSSFHVNLKGKYLYIIFQLLVTRIKIKILPLSMQLCALSGNVYLNLNDKYLKIGSTIMVGDINI